MRRLFIGLFVVATFLGCSDDWGKTNKDLITILESADSWQEYRSYAYTEPNGGGKKKLIHDPNLHYDGGGHMIFTVGDGVFTEYIYSNAKNSHYYKEYQMEQDGDESRYILNHSADKYYFRILEYDENNLLVEYDLGWVYARDDESGEYIYFDYWRTHFKKTEREDPRWKNKYMSEEEYNEKYKE